MSQIMSPCSGSMISPDSVGIGRSHGQCRFLGLDPQSEDGDGLALARRNHCGRVK